jgi:hypothetical protein
MAAAISARVVLLEKSSSLLYAAGARINNAYGQSSISRGVYESKD